jgi:hypothetical protein
MSLPIFQLDRRSVADRPGRYPNLFDDRLTDVKWVANRNDPVAYHTEAAGEGFGWRSRHSESYVGYTNRSLPRWALPD